MYATPLPPYSAVAFATANEDFVRRWAPRMIVIGLLTAAALFLAATHTLWSAGA